MKMILYTYGCSLFHQMAKKLPTATISGADILILVENDPDNKIKSAEDAIWWPYVLSFNDLMRY
jgi:hypothetical protein